MVALTRCKNRERSGSESHHFHKEYQMKSTGLTMKSKIKVCWTTDPAELGYGNPTGQWKKEDGESMSMKEALNFLVKLSKKLGKDVNSAISYQCDGCEVTRAQIALVVANDKKSKK